MFALLFVGERWWWLWWMQFTIEAENGEELPFLCVLLKNGVTGTLESSLSCTPKHADQVRSLRPTIPEFSKYPGCKHCSTEQKHCSTMELQKVEEHYLLRMRLWNGYSRNFNKKNRKQDERGGKWMSTTEQGSGPLQQKYIYKDCKIARTTRHHSRPQTHENYERAHFKP